MASFILCVRSARATVTVLSYWHMGEADSGAAVGGSCTNTVDSVGGDTLTFAPSGGLYPKYTSAVATAASQHTRSTLALTLVPRQYGTASAVTTVVNNFGIECWVNPGNITNAGSVLAYNGVRSDGWGLYQNATNFEVLYGGAAFLGSGTAIAQAGTWTHLALVRSNNVTILFTNGVVAFTNTATVPIAPSGAFTVGGDAVYSEFFAGSIDEVRVFTFAAGQFSTNDLLYYQSPPAIFSLGSSNYTESAVAGTNTVVLTANPTTASWTATANASWLHLAETSGVGGTNVSFSFDDNPGVPRTGTLTIAGQTATVSQAQAAISFPLDYTYYYGCDYMETSNSAGTYTVPITVTPNVGQWTCAADASWIHILTPSGTGSANLIFTVDANPTNGTARWDYNGIFFNSVGNGNPSYNTKFLVFQQAPSPGPGQQTYQFTGNLIPYLPQYIPTNASAALRSVQSNDVFYLTMTLVTGAPTVYYDGYACGVNDITFSVPSRGLFYSASFEDFEVVYSVNNPNELRWDDDGVDSTVDMIFWARDFTDTALPNDNMPDPLNLTGFHNGESFAQIILFDGVGENPELFYGNLVPMPVLSIAPEPPGSSVLSWVTSDATYTNQLQATANLNTGAIWQNVANSPVTSGLTNSVTVPNLGQQRFFRLQLP